MKPIYTLFISVTFFASCGMRIGYLGNTSTPTNHVDVYVEESAIKRPFTVIGKGYPEFLGLGEGINSLDKLQKKAVGIARQKGANAVLFKDYYVPGEGSNFYSATRIDSVGKGVVTTTSGSVRPTVTPGRIIYFLRYE